MSEKSTVSKTEKSTEKRYLKCILTEEEKKQIAVEIAQAICQKNFLEDELESIKGQIEAQVKEAEAKISGNAEKIRAGYEMREVECEIEIDKNKNTVCVTRIDTGEIIIERKLTYLDERRINL